MNTAWYLHDCKPLDLHHKQRAQQRQNQLTKPTGALGQLEEVVIALAAMQGKTLPQAKQIWISIFAGDHGVMAEQISAYPQQVTRQMLANFAQGGACISVIADYYQAQLQVIDCGTVGEPYTLDGVEYHAVASGTANFHQQPAMTEQQCLAAMHIGKTAAEQAFARHSELFIAGEMGIGNTCSASALACLLLQQPAAKLTGKGTGIDSATLHRKMLIIDQAVQRYQSLCRQQPLQALCCVGGFEIAAMVGAYIRAAQLGIACIVDGFIASVAALCAVKLQPQVQSWLIFAHQSAEAGHQAILTALQAKPLLQLDLRLGEGSGAGAAIGLIQLACHIHQHMATFAEAAVSDKSS